MNWTQFLRERMVPNMGHFKVSSSIMYTPKHKELEVSPSEG